MANDLHCAVTTIQVLEPKDIVSYLLCFEPKAHVLCYIQNEHLPYTQGDCAFTFTCAHTCRCHLGWLLAIIITPAGIGLLLLLRPVFQQKTPHLLCVRRLSRGSEWGLYQSWGPCQPSLGWQLPVTFCAIWHSSPSTLSPLWTSPSSSMRRRWHGSWSERKPSMVTQMVLQ